ncbi:hypothetical protein F5Y04DRAFT_283900 [Hypomontagnella monticulosa]|nr:hypothetical protein F5Y04DRAFT_283900 [Hypomontagnella monticulosa]
MPLQIPPPSVYGDDEGELSGEDWTKPSVISTVESSENDKNGESLDEEVFDHTQGSQQQPGMPMGSGAGVGAGLINVIETNFKTWSKRRWNLPNTTPKALILVQDHPNDWHQPAFSGYLLKETTDHLMGAEQGPILRLIPKPKTASMTLKQFWDAEIAPNVANHGYPLVHTRHGLQALNVNSIVNWIMGVEDEGPGTQEAHGYPEYHEVSSGLGLPSIPPSSSTSAQ